MTVFDGGRGRLADRPAGRPALIRRTREVGADEAVASLRAEAERVPDLVTEGVSAYRRSGATGSQAGLAAAVASFERAASLAGCWHPERSTVLNNLGLALFDRSSSRDARQTDLDQAVAMLEESAATAGQDLDTRSAALANLGSALLARRHQGDLERAATVLDEAARLAADTPAERARRLNNLGIALAECHLRSASLRARRPRGGRRAGSGRLPPGSTARPGGGD